MKKTSETDDRFDDFLLNRLNRRAFLKAATATSFALVVPRISAGALTRLERPVRMGLIADLHHDIMHDGIARTDAFVKKMATHPPDAIVQLGDFAYPNAKNSDVIEMFNQAHETSLHVIGNHDTDSGHTKQQCIDKWGMSGRYYSQNIAGLQLLVLDGNDVGSPTHKGGYVSYVGKEQIEWLKEQLATLNGPIIVVCHQPLAGAGAVDNAEELQSILGKAADKVILAINGHSHLDDVLRVKGVTYMHVNSASYQWVGGDYQHESYSKEVHAKHPWISYTCPYRDPLFATLTVDPKSLTIQIEGRESQWVGKSPAEVGRKAGQGLIDGEEVAPIIRNRTIARNVN